MLPNTARKQSCSQGKVKPPELEAKGSKLSFRVLLHCSALTPGASLRPCINESSGETGSSGRFLLMLNQAHRFEHAPLLCKVPSIDSSPPSHFWATAARYDKDHRFTDTSIFR